MHIISTGVKTYTCKICGYQKKETLKVTVPKTAIKSVTKAKKAFTVKWTKKSVTGYEIQYATNSKFTKGKRYYVKVRAYKTVSKVKYYGAWSKTKLSNKIK